MTTYNAPVNDALFLLKDVLKYERLLSIPGFETATPDVLEQVLNEAAKLCEEVIAPTNQEGDEVGCNRVKEGPGYEYPVVLTPQCFKEPWQKFKEGGWLGLSVPEQYGGQGFPYTIATVINEFVSSSNMSFSLLPGLTRGNIQALLAVASAPHKQHFIPPMTSGEWTGTMNLTEPHCGTDLGLIKTKAVDKNNGSYEITGQKIFISCGEHDLAENIIHLVLARVEGDPEGVKGISMFVVPKILTDLSHNKVTCGSIEEKMGIHGSPTCVMNFDGAVGYLVGERCKGLQAMFIMMNEARLGVAVQGLSQSELAYQNALQYARERIQGARLTAPKGESVAIINHPDVRRMLMDIRAFNEAARLLVYSAAMDSDLVNNSTDPAIQSAAEDRLGLLTPVLKGVLTDYGFENAVKAQQVLGGHGYIKEWGMEQIVRDARIAQIYEGANGIQALDLVARKLPKNGGRAIQTFFKESEGALTALGNDPEMVPYVTPVKSAMEDLKSATMWLVQNGMANPNNAGSASYDYMHLFGLVSLGMAWVMIARAAMEKKQTESDTSRWDSKLNTATYFMERMLPETALRLTRIKAGSAAMMYMNESEF